MSIKRFRNVIPQLALKGDDYAKLVPAEHQVDLTLQFKLQGRKESFDNVHAFSLKDGEFKIILRCMPDHVHVAKVKDLKTVWLHHNPFANPSEDVNDLSE